MPEMIKTENQSLVEKIGSYQNNGKWYLYVKFKEYPCLCGCGMIINSSPYYYEMPKREIDELIGGIMKND